MNTYVRIISNKTNVVFPTGLPYTAIEFLNLAVTELVDTGKVYDSDESAAAGGISLGKVYVTAYNHKEAPGGLIKIRLT